jgi:diguanylate cyclase
MLWRRSSKPSLAVAADLTADDSARPPSGASRVVSAHPVPIDADVELERALDTMAGMLRALGRHAFDLPETEAKTTGEVCERWATHLLLRSPAPDGNWDEGDPMPRDVRREWVAALHYVSGLRKSEQAYINKALHDLRQAIWAFVHSLNQTLGGEGEANGKVKAQLTRLQTAAMGPSTEDLKREAISVAETIGEIFEERRRRQVSQVAELGERMVALGRALEEARREVAIDALTRLYNRKTFDEELVRAADMAGLFRQRACLLIVDVDHFKAVNDTYGHPAGDEALRRLTGCLVRAFRRRDDVVARYGGEEFAAILRETELREGLMLCQRLLESVRGTVMEHAGRTFKVTVSIGITEAGPGESAEAWLERTDRALYAAKHAGRDRVEVSE